MGQTTIRVLPAFQSSAYPWRLIVQALNFEGGRFAHPKTLKKGTRSVFDYAYSWAISNAPGSLFSKSNKTGVRLLTDSLALFWCLIEEKEKIVARLFIGSAFDGSRGATTAGLGHKIAALAHEKDENGRLVCDMINHESGGLITIEKTIARGAKLPTYTLKRSKQNAPIADLIAKMDDTEIKALCPLEEVIRELSEEEEWQCLEKVIAPKTVAIIRESLKR